MISDLLVSAAVRVAIPEHGMQPLRCTSCITQENTPRHQECSTRVISILVCRGVRTLGIFQLQRRNALLQRHLGGTAVSYSLVDRPSSLPLPFEQPRPQPRAGRLCIKPCTCETKGRWGGINLHRRCRMQVYLLMVYVRMVLSPEVRHLTLLRVYQPPFCCKLHPSAPRFEDAACLVPRTPFALIDRNHTKLNPRNEPNLRTGEFLDISNMKNMRPRGGRTQHRPRRFMVAWLSVTYTQRVSDVEYTTRA